VKVLIVKLGALGDVIQATPLIRAIQAAHPGDEVHLLTTPAFQEIFDPWPGLAPTYFPRQGLRVTWRTIRWLRRQRFARVYDLQSNDRTTLLLAWSGIPERIGNHPRFPYTHHPATPDRGQCHNFARYRQVLASAGIQETAERPWLPSLPDLAATVRQWLTAHGLAEQGFALFHAGASPRHPHKIWPGYADLAIALQARGLAVVLVGAAADAAANARIAAATGAIDASGAFGIPALAELGRHARFAVTNDSGPMHVLSASGRPIFAFFGATNWRRCHALGQEAHVCNYERFCAEAGRDPQGIGGAEGLKHLSAAEILARIEGFGLL
jgi:ADP-heptose:LPS heptosyltransferase